MYHIKVLLICSLHGQAVHVVNANSATPKLQYGCLPMETCDVWSFISGYYYCLT